MVFRGGILLPAHRAPCRDAVSGNPNLSRYSSEGVRGGPGDNRKKNPGAFRARTACRTTGPHGFLSFGVRRHFRPKSGLTGFSIPRLRLRSATHDIDEQRINCKRQPDRNFHRALRGQGPCRTQQRAVSDRVRRRGYLPRKST